jgi:hypothetical protein
MNVVQTDESAVTRSHEVGLDEVRSHRVRHRVGRQGVLRQVPTGAAMGDDQGPVPRFLAGRGHAQTPNEKGAANEIADRQTDVS